MKKFIINLIALVVFFIIVFFPFAVLYIDAAGAVSFSDIADMFSDIIWSVYISIVLQIAFAVMVFCIKKIRTKGTLFLAIDALIAVIWYVVTCIA